ncbi:hypothetical protein BFW01_g12243 [Lasiodiplodia theobromae]|uniref:Uncharacterized protein n=1 Tax=Lasiodiplodia theobromae TaxID=45133 RepID=A0A5N5DKP1_9PEZI|nr:hypothetical protein DBV05_g4006 [Lasiodiplodia theobromae]KAF9640437.1 hypothetical protein BFW01_g12243 [Lasiodiplodia theobromae]
MLLFLFALPIHGLESTACYDLLGNALSSSYGPCNSSASTASACCLTNRDDDADICLDSGLCMSTSSGWTGFLWANGCTDPSAADDACPKLCDGIRGSNWTSANILQCSPGSWCCRESTDTPNCCDNSSAIISASSIGTLLLPTQTPGSEVKGTDSSATAVVGGVLGGLLVATLLTLAIVLFKWRTCKRAQGHGRADRVFKKDGSQRPVAELEGRERRELQG